MSMPMPIAEPVFWIFEWWQLLAMALLVVLLFFWKWYRNKQM